MHLSFPERTGKSHMWNVRKQRRAEERKESYVECEEAEQRRGEEGVLCGM
jgi:hypothetical protein